LVIRYPAANLRCELGFPARPVRPIKLSSVESHVQMLSVSAWFIIGLGLILFACQEGNFYKSIRNLNSQGATVVCLGDSLTEGVGANHGEDYPTELARRLSYPVINAGRSGNTSGDALARIEADVLAHNPRLVIVLLGGNDFLQQIPLSQTRTNLEEIVHRIQDQDAMVALVSIRLGLFTDEYGAVYEAIAAKRRALLIPEALKGILSDPKLRSDPIHPNGAGYRLLAERVGGAIKPLLAEADRSAKSGTVGIHTETGRQPAVATAARRRKQSNASAAA
jgi:acyl-CoA thioesterase-1